MTSETRLALLGLLASCNQSVHDLSVASDPLLVIHGHVDTATLGRRHPEAPLLGVLIWAGVPHLNPVCLKFPAPEIEPACPDPYGVFYGEIERAAPVGPDGNFDLVLLHLPRAAVSVGDEATRIAYGSLLVVEDVNGDGQLSLAPVGRGGPGPGGGLPDSDTIVAASFHSLRAAQQRVVFREGGFVADSNFYPAPGCAAPPPGFSIQTAPPYPAAPPAAEACTFRAATSRLDVLPLAADEALALQCRAAGRDPRVREPRAENQPSPATRICLAPDVLAVVSMDLCPRMIAFALAGCDRDPFCLSPEWDHRTSPPSWWPCH